MHLNQQQKWPCCTPQGEAAGTQCPRVPVRRAYDVTQFTMDASGAYRDANGFLVGIDDAAAPSACLKSADIRSGESLGCLGESFGAGGNVRGYYEAWTVYGQRGSSGINTRGDVTLDKKWFEFASRGFEHLPRGFTNMDIGFYAYGRGSVYIQHQGRYALDGSKTQYRVVGIYNRVGQAGSATEMKRERIFEKARAWIKLTQNRTKIDQTTCESSSEGAINRTQYFTVRA